jgi:hypothetical protein
MVFTYTTDNTGVGQSQYNVHFPENTLCDILMVGGGGAGGRDIGAGGGGGAVLYAQNVNIGFGTYPILVGNGGIPGETRGRSTTGFEATVLGGGCAANATWGNVTSSNSGGSGAGGKSNYGYVGGAVGVSTKGAILTTATTSTLYHGNVGGTGGQQSQGVQSAGGGGAGTVGGNGNGNGTQTGNGGNGVLVNILGVNYYWGGGGGGGGYWCTPTNGGLGGGGSGERYDGGGSPTFGTVGGSAYITSVNTNSGNVNTNASNGTGGGGGGSGYTSYNVGNGGSGIVIIRYLTPAKSSVIELINGTTPDANTAYRIGNYDGVFKVKKSVNNTEIDILSINQTTAQLVVPNGISATGNIATSNGNISTAYGNISTDYGSISAAGGITANGSISTTYGNISTTYGNISTPTLNTINPSDWLRKSECVLYLAATTRTRTGIVIGGTGSYTWTSVFHIPVNLIRSEYARPQIQWRLRMAFSSGNADSSNSYGFFNVYFDQFRDYRFIVDTAVSINSNDFTVTTNFDGSGTSRVIITIVNSNSPTHINVNIA